MSGYTYWHGVVIVDENGVPIPGGGGGTPANPSVVQGPAADGETSSGNPVLIGGRFNVTEPTYGNSEVGSLQIGLRGSLQVQLMSPDSTDPLTVTNGALSVTPTNAVAQGSATAGQSGALVQGAVTTASPTYTTGQTSPLSLTPAGHLRAAMFSAAGIATVVDASGAVNVRIMSAPLGGHLGARVMSAATTNATSVKASTGVVYGVNLHNSGAAAVFVKLYNKASAPVVGTDVPVETIAIPAGGRVDYSYTQGNAFSAGIAYAITNLVADTDTTAVTLNQVTGKIAYQ